MEPDRLQKRFRSKRSPQSGGYYKSSRAIDTTIYPEILVIVDYDGYRLHGGDNVQVKRYFVSFWNGVDLRYRLLKGPKIRISIAGIIISRVSQTPSNCVTAACQFANLLDGTSLFWVLINVLKLQDKIHEITI